PARRFEELEIGATARYTEQAGHAGLPESRNQEISHRRHQDRILPHGVPFVHRRGSFYRAFVRKSVLECGGSVELGGIAGPVGSQSPGTALATFGRQGGTRPCSRPLPSCCCSSGLWGW